MNLPKRLLSFEIDAEILFVVCVGSIETDWNTHDSTRLFKILPLCVCLNNCYNSVIYEIKISTISKVNLYLC